MALTTNAAALARVKRLLAEKNAKLASCTSTVFVGGGTIGQKETTRLTRYWSKILDQERVVAEEFLKARTSVSNAEDSLYVTDPQADGEVREGRWRRLSVFSTKLKTDADQQGVYETLVYWPEGWGDFGTYCAEATPLHHEDVTLSMLMSEPYTAAHANERGKIITARNSFDLETGLWNGEYRVDEARPYGPVETWSGSLTEETRTRERVNQTDAPYATAAAMRAAIAGGGKSLRTSINLNRSALLDTSDSLTEELEYPPAGTAALKHVHGTVRMKETVSSKTNAAALPADDQPTTPGSQTDLSFSLTAGGRLNWTHRLNEAARYPSSGTVKSIHGSLLLKETDERADQVPPTEWAAIEDLSGEVAAGKSITRGLSLDSLGLISFTKSTREAQAWPAAGPAEWTAGSTLELEHGTRRVNDVALPSGTLYAPEAGHRKGLSFNIDVLGSIDWTVIDREDVASDIVNVTTGSLLLEEVRSEQVNAAAAPAIGQGEKGVRKDASISITPTARINWSSVVRTSAPADESAKGGSCYYDDDTARGVNSHALPEGFDSNPHTPGQVLNRSFSIDAVDGTLNWAEDKRTFIASAVVSAITGTAQETLTTSKAINQSALPTTGLAHATGYIRGISFNLDQNGLMDWDKMERAAIAWSKSASTGDHRTIRAETRAGNQVALPANFVPGAGNKGTIQQLSFSFNDYGLFDYAHMVLTATPGTKLDVRTEKLRKVYSLRFWNQTDLPADASIGGTVVLTYAVSTCNFSFSDFGLYDGELTVTVPNQTTASFGPWVIEDSPERWVRITPAYNLTDLPTAAGSSATADGVMIVTHNPRVNEFGLMDNVKTETHVKSPLGIPLAQAVTWYELGDRRAERLPSGSSYVWVVTQWYHHHNQKVFLSAANARAHAAGGHSGSYWRPIGNGLFMADKVVKKDNSTSP